MSPPIAGRNKLPIPTTLEHSSPESVHRFKAENSPYKRLEAAESILNNASPDNHEDLVAACRDYVRLDIAISSLDTAIALTGNVVGCLKSILEDGDGSILQPPAPRNLTRTRWEDQGPWDLSTRLFKILKKRICTSGEHEAKLQLAGIQLDKSCGGPLSLNMFFSTCLPTALQNGTWQEVCCTSIGQ